MIMGVCVCVCVCVCVWMKGRQLGEMYYLAMSDALH